MFTQCPGCYSIYRVDADILSRARGQVCCGLCELRFDAIHGLRDNLPPPLGENAELQFETDKDSKEPLMDEWYREPIDASVDESEGTDQLPEDSEEPQEEPAEDNNFLTFDEEAVPEHEDTIPAAVPSVESIPRHRLLWGLGCGLLLVVALVQFLVWAPPVLATYPGLRPLAESLCGLTGCELKPRQELDSIELISRDVRSHPSVDDALIVSATMVNEADFTQPYPLLELRLTNVEGHVVAMRRFSPAEYLPGGVNREAGMPSGSRVLVALELADPGSPAVGFEIAFRPAPPLSG